MDYSENQILKSFSVEKDTVVNVLETIDIYFNKNVESRYIYLEVEIVKDDEQIALFKVRNDDEGEDDWYLYEYEGTNNFDDLIPDKVLEYISSIYIEYFYKLDLIDNYWVDKNGNRWHKAIYTEGDATEKSKALVNCKNCTNCTKCENCTDCTDCEDCKNCTNCKNCYYCENCTNCDYCDNCGNCEKCNYCSICDDLNNCEAYEYNKEK